MNAPEPVVAQTPRPMPHVMNTYGRLPIAMSHGRGCWLWDTEGRKYLDGLGGILADPQDMPRVDAAVTLRVSLILKVLSRGLIDAGGQPEAGSSPAGIAPTPAHPARGVVR